MHVQMGRRSAQATRMWINGRAGAWVCARSPGIGWAGSTHPCRGMSGWLGVGKRMRSRWAWRRIIMCAPAARRARSGGRAGTVAAQVQRGLEAMGLSSAQVACARARREARRIARPGARGTSPSPRLAAACPTE